MIYDLAEAFGGAGPRSVVECPVPQTESATHDTDGVHHCGRHMLLVVHQGLVCLYWDDELLTVCSAGEWILCRDFGRSRVCPCPDSSRFCAMAYGGRPHRHGNPGGQCLFAVDPERIYFRGKISPSLRSNVKLLCTSPAEPDLTDICLRNETLWRVLGSITSEVQSTQASRSADSLIVTGAERSRLDELRGYLESNPGADCKFCELCQQFSLKASKVKCCFKACYGETVYSYWKGVKLDHARRLLESGSCNVTEAALAIGYDNPSHFASAFRKRFGLPPKRYQTRHLSSVG